MEYEGHIALQRYTDIETTWMEEEKLRTRCALLTLICCFVVQRDTDTDAMFEWNEWTICEFSSKKDEQFTDYYDRLSIDLENLPDHLFNRVVLLGVKVCGVRISAYFLIDLSVLVHIYLSVYVFIYICICMYSCSSFTR